MGWRWTRPLTPLLWVGPMAAASRLRRASFRQPQMAARDSSAASRQGVIRAARQPFSARLPLSDRTAVRAALAWWHLRATVHGRYQLRAVADSGEHHRRRCRNSPYTVAFNGGPSRIATLTFNGGATFTIQQEGAPGSCSFAFSPNTATVTALEAAALLS